MQAVCKEFWDRLGEKIFILEFFPPLFFFLSLSFISPTTIFSFYSVVIPLYFSLLSLLLLIHNKKQLVTYTGGQVTTKFLDTPGPS